MENQDKFPYAAKFSKICMNDCKSIADCKLCDRVLGLGKISLTDCVCETKSTCAICDQMCNLDTKLFDIVLHHSNNKSKDSVTSEKNVDDYHSTNKSKESVASKNDVDGRRSTKKSTGFLENEKDDDEESYSSESKEKNSNQSVRISKGVIDPLQSSSMTSDSRENEEATKKVSLTLRSSRKSCLSMHVCGTCARTSEFIAACESFAYCPACQKQECSSKDIQCTSKDTCKLCSSSNPQLRFREILDELKTTKVESLVEIKTL
jgi:hypothetical protein